MKITIEGKFYDINLDKAIADGYLKKLPIYRKVKVTDIPNNTIFKWIDSEGRVNLYQMLNNKLMHRGQCLGIVTQNQILCNVTKPYTAWIDTDPNLDLAYWDILKEEWISQIEV